MKSNTILFRGACPFSLVTDAQKLGFLAGQSCFATDPIPLFKGGFFNMLLALEKR